MMRRVVRCVVLGLVVAAALPAAAGAEIVHLSTGRTMSVKSHRLEGQWATLVLRAGGEITCPASLIVKVVPDEVAPAYADGNVRPHVPLSELAIAGISLSPAPPSAAALGALISLGSEYRVGLQNFYVITRYNRSAYYATAVADLAQALAAARAAGTGK